MEDTSQNSEKIESENTTSTSSTNHKFMVFWEEIKLLLGNKEVSKLLGLYRFTKKWESLIDTLVTIIVAIGLIYCLIFLVDNHYLDKGAFGVMFGTVFGYLLSWRFGK